MQRLQPSKISRLKPSRRVYVRDPEGYGSSIYAYCNVRTNQVLYSLTRSLDSNKALKQLPDLGPNSRPPTLRKDVWKPLYTLAYPDDNPIAGQQGREAFRMLREYRRVHELYWEPTEELSRNHSKDEIEAIKKELEERGGSKKESAYDIIKRNKKKLRRGIVMDQKANSIADLAAVLVDQVDARRRQWLAWRRNRREEVARMVVMVKAANNGEVEELDERLEQIYRAMEDNEGATEKKSVIRTKTMKLRKERLVLEARKNDLTFAVGSINAVHAQIDASRESVQSIAADTSTKQELDEMEDRLESEAQAALQRREDSQGKVADDVRQQVLDDLKQEVFNRWDEGTRRRWRRLQHDVAVEDVAVRTKEAAIQSLQAAGLHLDIAQPTEAQPDTANVEGSEGGLGQLDSEVPTISDPRFLKEDHDSVVRRLRDQYHDALARASAVREKLNQTTVTAESTNIKALTELQKEQQRRELKQDLACARKEAGVLRHVLTLAGRRIDGHKDQIDLRRPLTSHVEYMQRKGKEAEAKKQSGAESQEWIDARRAEHESWLGKSKNEMRIAAARTELQTTTGHSVQELEDQAQSLDGPVRNKLIKYIRLISNRDRHQQDSENLREADELLAQEGGAGKLLETLSQEIDRLPSLQEREKSLREESWADRHRMNDYKSSLRRTDIFMHILRASGRLDHETLETTLKDKFAHDGDFRAQEGRIDVDAKGLPWYYELLPSFPSADKRSAILHEIENLKTSDAYQKNLPLLAPIFQLDGVKVQWSNIMDAEYAEQWPESLEHEPMGLTRHTAKQVEYQPKMAVIDVNDHVVQRENDKIREMNTEPEARNAEVRRANQKVRNENARRVRRHESLTKVAARKNEERRLALETGKLRRTQVSWVDVPELKLLPEQGEEPLNPLMEQFVDPAEEAAKAKKAAGKENEVQAKGERTKLVNRMASQVLYGLREPPLRPVKTVKGELERRTRRREEFSRKKQLEEAMAGETAGAAARETFV